MVADASRHPEIDGSGTVVKTKAGAPQQLTQGSVFGMHMKMGIPYSMKVAVIESEPGQAHRLADRVRRPRWGVSWAVASGATKFEPVDGGTWSPRVLGHLQDKQAFMLSLRQHRSPQGPKPTNDVEEDRLRSPNRPSTLSEG